MQAMKQKLYKNYFLLFIVGVFVSNSLFAKAPSLTLKDLNSPPPRIIRTCCSFGVEVGITGMPLKKLSEITSLHKIGNHKYLGDRFEANGIIYTKLGGFIDLGHLRDQADWTAYLYSLILSKKAEGKIIQKIGYEGGRKTLTIKIPADLEDIDAALLAGRITYDLSIWHEIATWFGASYLPFVPERYSSFSIEDSYSNLLGILIGIKAIQSDLPYEEAMTILLKEKLIELKAVETDEETYAAMKAVEDIWWTNDVKLPSAKVLKQRNLEIGSSLKPWLVAQSSQNENPQQINLEVKTSNGVLLSQLYEISFKLNHKFPLKEIVPLKNGRLITQKDFDMLMIYVKDDLQKRYALNPKKIEAELRKKQREEMRENKKITTANKP